MDINCIMKYYSSLTCVQSFATTGYKHFGKCIRMNFKIVETSLEIKQEKIFCLTTHIIKGVQIHNSSTFDFISFR